MSKYMSGPTLPDPPELARAIDALRQIYWREYGRGWKDAVANIQRVLTQEFAKTDGETDE
jgi:hypothetical protein